MAANKLFNSAAIDMVSNTNSARWDFTELDAVAEYYLVFITNATPTFRATDVTVSNVLTSPNVEASGGNYSRSKLSSRAINLVSGQLRWSFATSIFANQGPGYTPTAAFIYRQPAGVTLDSVRRAIFWLDDADLVDAYNRATNGSNVEIIPDPNGFFAITLP